MGSLFAKSFKVVIYIKPVYRLYVCTSSYACLTKGELSRIIPNRNLYKAVKYDSTYDHFAASISSAMI